MPIEVIMPALGMAQETGIVVRWIKRPGDAVARGEPLLEVETDKAVVEVEAPATGTLARVTAEKGAEVPVGEPIALILAEGETLAPALTTPIPTGPIAGGAARLRPASPKARRLAAESGIDLSRVAGSGPEGAVLAADLGPAVTAGGVDAELEVGRTWRVMAERTARAWSAPHFYLTREVLAGRLLEWRGALAERGERVSVTDLLVTLAAQTLSKHPHLAAAWRDGRLVRRSRVSIGVAVATDEGLTVPVMPDADQKPPGEIAAWRELVVERARAQRLTPADLEGGAFTISNLGMHGVDAFTAIINGGQAAILSVGRIAERPVVRAGRVEAAQTMILTLGCDHRAVDGARAAFFLRDLVEAIEDPAILFPDASDGVELGGHSGGIH